MFFLFFFFGRKWLRNRRVATILRNENSLTQSSKTKANRSIRVRIIQNRWRIPFHPERAEVQECARFWESPARGPTNPCPLSLPVLHRILESHDSTNPRWKRLPGVAPANKRSIRNSASLWLLNEPRPTVRILIVAPMRITHNPAAPLIEGCQTSSNPLTI